MSDEWTKRGWNCVEVCTEQGLPITASYVNEIVKQRRDLLTALKGLLSAQANDSEFDIEVATFVAMKAVEATTHLQ